jgi:hypothetical protein
VAEKVAQDEELVEAFLAEIKKVFPASRKVDTRLPGKGELNSHGARPVHQIISMIEWIRTSRLSKQNSISLFLA